MGSSCSGKEGFWSERRCSTTISTVVMGRKGHNAAREGLLCERITECAAAGDMNGWRNWQGRELGGFA